MQIIDGHCDVLYKMYEDPQLMITSDEQLDASLAKLKAGEVHVQSFAMFLTQIPERDNFDLILEYIDLFERKVLKSGHFSFIRYKEQLEACLSGQSDQIGALLSLEGADALQGNMMYLRTLYRLGVRSIGLTWNYGNWAADGVLEPRQGGLTKKGIEFVKACNDIGMIIDVSHLAEQGFWDVVTHSSKPFIASHSNVFEVCRHPRNLNHSQIEAIISRQGIMGLTFVPEFLNDSGTATITDVLHHVDAVCALGGKDHIAFGSDFDGIDNWVQGLEHAGKYSDLVEHLLKAFDSETVQQFMWRNWYNFYMKHLPLNE